MVLARQLRSALAYIHEVVVVLVFATLFHRLGWLPFIQNNRDTEESEDQEQQKKAEKVSREKETLKGT